MSEYQETHCSKQAQYLKFLWLQQDSNPQPLSSNENSTIWPNWPNGWGVSWVLICVVHLTVCYYHVTSAFQSESTLCSCLNIKELLMWNKRDIWSLSDCNWTRIHNHLVWKRTLNHLAKLAKWLSCDMIRDTRRDMTWAVAWNAYWPKVWAFAYKLSGWGFESRWLYLVQIFGNSFIQMGILRGVSRTQWNI